MKFGCNLMLDEILDQALHFRRMEPIDHVVFHDGRADDEDSMLSSAVDA